MSISSIFILTAKGDVVIDKHYRGVVSRTVCDSFNAESLKAASIADIPPVLQTTKGYLFHVFRDNMFVLGLTTTDTPPLLVFEFLHRLFDVLKEYIGKVDEDSLRDNFVTVYQLLDEMLDGGFPFTTEPNILKEMIKPPTLANRAAAAAGVGSTMGDSLPTGTLSNVPWRKAGVKYAKNEIYFDIIEEVDMTMDKNGLIASHDISGEVLVNCRLSGMPDLTLQFNNPKIIDDCSFHPCVRYGKYEKEKVVSFIPPDGNFKLMSFKINTPSQYIQLPIYGKSVLSFSGGGGHLQITVGSKPVGKDVELDEIVVKITLPRQLGGVNLTSTFGKISYDETTKDLVWTIGKLPKDKSATLTGNLTVPAGAHSSLMRRVVIESSPSTQLFFKIMRYSAVGLTITNLNVDAGDLKYKPFKGVRSITKAGTFLLRS